MRVLSSVESRGRERSIVYARRVRWDTFLEDLGSRVDVVKDPDRAGPGRDDLRLRAAHTPLSERLRALCEAQRPASVALIDGTTLAGRLRAVGADWLAIADEASPCGLWLVPFASLVAVGLAQAEVRDSLRDATSSGGARMLWAMVMRDLARRRVPVSVQVRGSHLLTGTIDRVGADHLELALHDAAAFRRAGAVHGHRLVALAAIVWLRPDAHVAGR